MFCRDQIATPRSYAVQLNRKQPAMYQIHQADASSLDLLVQTRADSFYHDRATWVKYHCQEKQESTYESYLTSMIKPALSGWLPNSHKYCVLQAIDPSTESVHGCVCIGARGLSNPDNDIEDEDNLSSLLKRYFNEDEDIALASFKSHRTLDSETHSRTNVVGTSLQATIIEPRRSTKHKPISELNAMLSISMNNLISQTNTTYPTHLFIASLAVHPRYQSIGLASHILRNIITPFADTRNLTVWIHASENAERLFSGNEFEEIVEEAVEIDLRDYMPRFDHHVGGTPSLDLMMKPKYTYRFMIRSPRHRPSDV